MFTESCMLQAVGRFLRAKEQPGAQEKHHQPSPAGDQLSYGLESSRRASARREEAARAETETHHHQRGEHVEVLARQRHAATGDEGKQKHQRQEHHHYQHEKEEGRLRLAPAALLQGGSRARAAPDEHGVGLASPRHGPPRGEEGTGRVIGGASSSSSSALWAALQVSIPRLEVNGPLAKVLSDGGSSGDSGSSSSGGGGGSFTAAAVAAAMSGVSSAAHGWRDVAAGAQTSPAFTRIGEGRTASLFVRPPTDGEVDNIAARNGASTVSAGKVAASSGAEGGRVAAPPLFLRESQPLSLHAVHGVPGGILDQPQPQLQPPPTPSPPPPSKSIPFVEVYKNEEGDAVYRFNKAAPTRRGKWCRMEEEYAKRIIRDFVEGVLDAPAGVGLRQLLSSKLHCEVMRVSKKFCGWQCVGKRCYRSVVHHDGRTTRARTSLFEMEQNWLKTFPSPSRSKPADKPVIDGDGGGEGSTTSVGGASECPAPPSPAGGGGRPERGATASQTWPSRVAPGLAGDPSTGAIEALAKGERPPYCESASSESLDEEPSGEPSGEPSMGEQGHEVQRQRYDGHGLESPSAKESDRQQQQQLQAVPRSGGYDHHLHHAVGIGSNSSASWSARDDVNRRSWPSHGTHCMQGGAHPRERVSNPRGQHCENMRGSPTGPSFWQRREAERRPSGSTSGSDRNADLYPAFSTRGEVGGDAEAAVQRGVTESPVAASSLDEVSLGSGNEWSEGRDVHSHQQRPQFPCTNSRREGGYAHENTQDRHRERTRTIVSGPPRGGKSWARREHNVGRHEVSAADQTDPDPFPHYKSERQRTASGSHSDRSGGGNGGRPTASDGVPSPKEAAFGRRPFQLRPETTALPFHLRVNPHEEAIFLGNEQAAKTTVPEPARSLPEKSYRAESPQEPLSEQHHMSWQFREGKYRRYYPATGQKRARENDLTPGLERHRPTKTPRVSSPFFRLGAGGSNGGRDDDGDDSSLYPRYLKHEPQPQLQQQRRRPGTATARYWRSERTEDNSDAWTAVEAYRPAGRSNLPSRDCLFRVSTLPISMSIPSNEYGPVVVSPGEAVPKFCKF